MSHLKKHSAVENPHYSQARNLVDNVIYCRTKNFIAKFFFKLSFGGISHFPDKFF